ncbi:MAG: amidohydrolase family protein [Myxococcales bacterium]|nr:amidohydrolase family protein [Myxococcales bacterium]
MRVNGKLWNTRLISNRIATGLPLAFAGILAAVPLACPTRAPEPSVRRTESERSRIRDARADDRRVEPSQPDVPPSLPDATQVASPTPYSRAALPILDIHTHVDPTATRTVLSLFDARGIHTAVNLSAGFEGAGLEEALAQQRESRGRILPFCTLPWRATGHPQFVTESVRILERCRALGVRGLKIPKVLGLGARDIDGSRLRVDAPRLDPIFAAAERLGMMVLIHTGDPKAFFQPPNPQNERWEELQAHPSWSFYGAEWPSFDEILGEFERRVLRHRRLVFVGAHFGNAAEEPDRVARLLERAPRYHIDTSARVPEFGRHPSARMRAFFTRWQDRILFGTDLGLGDDMGEWMLGSHGNERTTQRDVDRYFSATFRYYEANDPEWENPTPIQGRWNTHPIALPRDILAKVYGANAARLLGITWPPPTQ